MSEMTYEDVKSMRYVDQFIFAVFNLIDEKYGRVLKYFEGPPGEPQWACMNFESNTGKTCSVAITFYLNTTNHIEVDFSYLVGEEEKQQKLVHTGVHNPLYCASWVIERVGELEEKEA